jgi:transcription elongation factor Elf1
MAKQAEKELRFVCYNCGKETTLIVTVTKALPTKSKSATRVYYCEHCNRANKIEVPDNVDGYRFILGRDKGFLRYTSDGMPLLEGEKDV